MLVIPNKLISLKLHNTVPAPFLIKHRNRDYLQIGDYLYFDEHRVNLKTLEVEEIPQDYRAVFQVVREDPLQGYEHTFVDVDPYYGRYFVDVQRNKVVYCKDGSIVELDLGSFQITRSMSGWIDATVVNNKVMYGITKGGNTYYLRRINPLTFEYSGPLLSANEDISLIVRHMPFTIKVSNYNGSFNYTYFILRENGFFQLNSNPLFINVLAYDYTSVLYVGMPYISPTTLLFYLYKITDNSFNLIDTDEVDITYTTSSFSAKITEKGVLLVPLHHRASLSYTLNKNWFISFANDKLTVIKNAPIYMANNYLCPNTSIIFPYCKYTATQAKRGIILVDTKNIVE